MSIGYKIYKIVGSLAYLLILMCIQFYTDLANPNDTNKTYVNKILVKKNLKLVHLPSWGHKVCIRMHAVHVLA